FTPHHFADSHRSIIYHDRKLIGRDIVAAPDNKIAEIATGHGRLPSDALIDKLDSLAIRHTKSPMRPSWSLRLCSCRRHWRQISLACRWWRACRLEILSCCGRHGHLYN